MPNHAPWEVIRMKAPNPGTTRIRRPELMDDPDLEEEEHLAALEGLSRLNRLSRSARLFWRPLAGLAQRLGHRTLRVLDVASGAGDIPLTLWRRARRSGLELEIHGVDFSPRAVEWARRNAWQAGAPLQFHTLNVLEDEFPSSYDALISSLFLHHLSDGQVVTVLHKMAQAARHLVLIHDLRRSPDAVWLAWGASRLFTRSHVVAVDAPRSVRAAFTREELEALANAAGLLGAAVTRRWPYRLLLSWERP